MLKKAIALSLIISLFLCGCSRNSLNKTGEYTVAAIGFSKDEDLYKVFVEAVVVNSEDSDKEISKLLFEGSAKSIEEAFKNAINQSAKPLEVSHCAVLVVENEVGQNEITDITEFCLKVKDITVSVALVKTENVKELLSLSAFSSVAVGFDIVSILETQYLEKNISFSNRLYEISRKNGQDRINALPEFTIVNERTALAKMG